MGDSPRKGFITTVFLKEEYHLCSTSLAHSLDRETSIFLNPVFANRSVVSSAFEIPGFLAVFEILAELLLL
ncbi:MAG: hypothetical protein M3Y53_10710 [Thermoproteota archaeon]|nr:hypothetical protein [Thermoproteota archaeon]